MTRLSRIIIFLNTVSQRCLILHFLKIPIRVFVRVRTPYYKDGNASNIDVFIPLDFSIIMIRSRSCFVTCGMETIMSFRQSRHDNVSLVESQQQNFCFHLCWNSFFEMSSFLWWNIIYVMMFLVGILITE